MKEEDKKLLEKISKDNVDKVSFLRKHLQEDLERLCIEKGGHNFWGWQDASWWDVGGSFHKTESRRCSICGKREHNEIKVEE